MQSSDSHEQAEKLVKILSSIFKSQFRQLKECSDIEALGGTISFIAFIQQESLEEANMTHLYRMAILDTFAHPHEPVDYYFMNNLACMESHKMNPAAPGFALNLREGYPLMTVQEPEFNF